MIGQTREGLRDLITRTAGVFTQWSKDATMATPAAMTVPVGALWAPTASTPTGAGLRGQAVIRMRVIASTEVGVDESRSTFNVGTDQIETTLNGARSTTISFTCISYANNESLDLLERLRSRLGRAGVRAELRALGLSVAAIHPLFETSNDTAVLDVKFNETISERDTTATSDYIGTASAGGTFTP